MNIIQNLDFKVTGQVHILRFNEDGKLVEERDIPNLVVTTGKAYIAQRLGQSSPPAIMSHMAIGSDSTAAVVGQSALLAELNTAVNRPALSSTVVSAASVTYAATFGAGVATGNVFEAGIFNALTAGTMLCRTTFPIVTKQAGDTIAITWVVTVS